MLKSRLLARLVLSTGLLATVPAAKPDGVAAQAPLKLDTEILASWSWRNIGPRLGGRSLAVAGSTARPLEYFAGVVGGGVWKTDDAGNSWRPVSDGWFASASVGSIGICEANPDVVYVGMGEGQFRGTMSSGDGAYATRDGGRTWTFVGLGSSTGQTMIPRMRVDPGDCDRVYAAVLGDPYGPNDERGVFRSLDGGSTWERVLFGGPLAGASDLTIDPLEPRILYATIWDVHRPPWGGRTQGTSGIFRSSDAGDTWTELTGNPGLPDTVIGKVGISASGGTAGRVYVVIEAAPGHGGVFRSDDGGETWTKTNGNNALFHRAEYYNRITADPLDSDRVYVLNKNFFRSDDGGRTFELVDVPHGDNHDLWIAPDDNRRMVQANDGGPTVTWNAGRSWSDIDLPTAQMYHTFVTADFPAGSPALIVRPRNASTSRSGRGSPTASPPAICASASSGPSRSCSPPRTRASSTRRASTSGGPRTRDGPGRGSAMISPGPTPRHSRARSSPSRTTTARTTTPPSSRSRCHLTTKTSSGPARTTA